MSGVSQIEAPHEGPLLSLVLIAVPRGSCEYALRICDRGHSSTDLRFTSRLHAREAFVTAVTNRSGIPTLAPGICLEPLS